MSKASDTRLHILQKAFELIYMKGYQATSVDDIIGLAKLTKGAFFYHFTSKHEMGIAMIREVMLPGMYRSILKPFDNANNPVNEIYLMMKGLLQDQFFDVKYGCPAMNLIEEMAPLDETFKKELGKLVIAFRKAIEKNVAAAMANGQLARTINAEQVSIFVTTGYSGIRNMGKIYGKSCYSLYLSSLKNYLENLK
jgi:AcrR family transcriptional regulator